MNAAKEPASFVGFNEATVRRYCEQFYDSKGKFAENKQGSYKRKCLLNDEELCLNAAMWAREHAYKKGAANMTAGMFCQGVNDELLLSCFAIKPT